TVASNKQTHGSAENLNRLVRKVFRCLCSEKRLDTRDWVKLVPMVNHILNHRVSDSLGGVAPVELFTGQPRDQSMQVFVDKKLGNAAEIVSFSQSVYKGFREDLRELRLRLNELHRAAVTSAEDTRRKSRAQANKNRREFKRFELGDFVLRGIPEGSSVDRRRNSIQHRWIGPYQVVASLSDKVYICKDLLTGVLYELHADYMFLYEDQQFVVSDQVKRQMVFDNIGREAKCLLDFKMVNGTPIVKLKWKGVGDKSDELCWHPLSLATQLWPIQRVLKFLADLTDNQAAQRFAEKFMEQDLGRRCEPLAAEAARSVVV
ncbi:MAG TPA: hypothetical protein VGD31_02775, partial [Sphingobacteriaceae bacterium]